MFIEFAENIKDYIRNSTVVEEYIYKFIKKYMEQFQDICEVEKIKFPLRGVKLNIAVKNNCEEKFEHIRKNIEAIMPKYIGEQANVVDFPIDQEFLKRLEDEKIIVVKHKEKEFIYIASTDDLS